MPIKLNINDITFVHKIGRHYEIILFTLLFLLIIITESFSQSSNDILNLLISNKTISQIAGRLDQGRSCFAATAD